MTEQRMTARQRRFAEGVSGAGRRAAGCGTGGLPGGARGERLLRVARAGVSGEAQGRRPAARGGVGRDEVLQYLTRVLRADAGQSSMKAAELLGKRLGLFAEQGESLPPPVIVDDIRAAALPDGGEALSEAGGRRESAAGALPGGGEAALPGAKGTRRGEAARRRLCREAEVRWNDRAAVGTDRAGVPRRAPRRRRRRAPRILAARRGVGRASRASCRWRSRWGCCGTRPRTP